MQHETVVVGAAPLQATSPAGARVPILGVPVDGLDMQATLERIAAMVDTGRVTGQRFQVATANVDFLINAQKDPALLEILQSADLITADGMPLVWASRILRQPFPERVTGADLVPLLARRAAQSGFSIFFYGAGPGIAERAAKLLAEQNPGLRVAGCYSPPYAKTIEIPEEARALILRSRPDILFVALGNPKQEKWIARFKQELPAPVMIGIGGTLDFVAGTIRRAPLWMQRSGLEWLFRISQEPKRLWKRYVIDIVQFSGLFLKQLLDRKQARRV